MSKVSLPELPKGKEFEEFLAAYFQSQGLYVERNILDRQEAEVLELDIITTQYEKGSLPENKLFEVKSGDWGFNEIFKIRGWLDYLNFEKGYLLVKSALNSLDFYKKIAGSLQVDIFAVPDLNKTAECLVPLVAVEQLNQIDVTIWRFSYWVERNLIKLLKAKKKSAHNFECYTALDRYLFLINNRIFFTRNIIERAERLYDSYKDYPHISACLGNELEGNPFNGGYENVPKSLYSKTYYKCEFTDLALSTFIEHRARLSILKSAIDYQLYKLAGKDHNEKTTIMFGDGRYEYTLLDLLPKSFKDGLNTIAEHPYFYRYPIFWQWFFWVFGGFILKDYEGQEHNLLSQKTGIPVENIPQAFSSYEILFPMQDGWFLEPPNTNIRFIKLFPTPYMGIGANFRRYVYSEDKTWKGFKLRGLHTLDDMKKWNNVAVELLRKNL